MRSGRLDTPRRVGGLILSAILGGAAERGAMIAMTDDGRANGFEAAGLVGSYPIAASSYLLLEAAA